MGKLEVTHHERRAKEQGEREVTWDAPVRVLQTHFMG
jgi:hypothetical protein